MTRFVVREYLLAKRSAAQSVFVGMAVTLMVASIPDKDRQHGRVDAVRHDLDTGETEAFIKWETPFPGGSVPVKQFLMSKGWEPYAGLLR